MSKQIAELCDHGFMQPHQAPVGPIGILREPCAGGQLVCNCVNCRPHASDCAVHDSANPQPRTCCQVQPLELATGGDR